MMFAVVWLPSVQPVNSTTWVVMLSIMSPGCRSSRLLSRVDTSSRVEVTRLEPRCQAIETKPEQSCR